MGMVNSQDPSDQISHEGVDTNVKVTSADAYNSHSQMMHPTIINRHE
jgi:hypothetical protein